jgi:hypothetical protein
MIDLRFQPMQQRPKYEGRKCTDGRRRYQRSPFGKTVGAGYEDLERELRFLEATDIVIESGHERTQIRNDGWPRSGASPAHPAVRLFFKCKHGNLRYECAAFAEWQANLRAIGLWMQRQRLALEEWGIGSGGEAYRGFAQLPAGSAIEAGEWANAEEAAGFLLRVGKHVEAEGTQRRRDVVSDAGELRQCWREASKEAHPDAGGSDELMSKVNRAKAFIEKHGGAACH